MSEIIFLSHEGSRDDEARRQVRSRAAQHSHRIGPRKPKARKARPKRQRKSDLIDEESEGGSSLSRRGSAISIATSATSASASQAGSPTRAADAIMRPPIPRMGSHRDEPFDAYPVPAQSWFPEVIDYLWTFMLRGWASLPTTPTQQDTALLWVKRLTMSDPTYFYMNLLSVTGDLVSRGQRDPRLLVWLTSQVVTSINASLASTDPDRNLSIGTILTVGRLALREILVGDIQAGITFHRPAFARMILLKGGVGGMELPELVREHLSWGDRMMRRKTGIRMRDIEPGLAGEAVFGGEGGMGDVDPRGDRRVLNAYLPYRRRRAGSVEEEEEQTRRFVEGQGRGRGGE